jgi:hypothetical protein
MRRFVVMWKERKNEYGEKRNQKSDWLRRAKLPYDSM